jgi:hypothetical protein
VDRLIATDIRSSSAVGVVYFDYKEASKQAVQTIFLGLLRQFCDQSYHLAEVRKALENLHELCVQQNKRKPSLDECYHLLGTILRTYLEARIDAAESSCLSERAHKSSILREKVIRSICAKAKGMFLLAELQIKHLEGAITEREINESLQALPEKIDDQYKSYIERIEAQRQGSLALRAVMWIHGACRPLTPDELLEALSVQDRDTDLDSIGIATMETLLNISGG